MFDIIKQTFDNRQKHKRNFLINTKRQATNLEKINVRLNLPLNKNLLSELILIKIVFAVII